MPERNKDSYSVWGPKDLTDFRMSFGLDRQDLAKKLGVSYRMYCYYESGHTKIDKPLEYAVRWICNKNEVASEKSAQGTLTDFQKDRINRLMDAIDRYPTSNLDEKGQKILSQCVDEISMLTSHLSES